MQAGGSRHLEEPQALETFLRYHHEQGLSKKVWKPEEIFAEEMLKL